MKRIVWLRILICALIVVALSMSAPAWAGYAKKPKYRLTLGHCLTEDHSYHKGALYFAEKCALYSNGELKIDIYPNFQLGSEQEQYKAVQMGTQDIAIGAVNNAAPFWPPLNVFIMPYLFRSYEHAFNAVDGPAGAELKEAFRKATGFRSLAFFNVGFRSLGNSKRPIHKPSDLKGILFRVPKNPVMVATTKAMGADAIPMAWSETFNALKQGVVDGHDVPATVCLSMKFHEANQKYYSLTRHFFLFATMLMNDKKYQSLPPHIQRAIDRAAKEAEQYQRGYERRATIAALEQMKAVGVKINDIPDKTPFVKAVQPVWEMVYKKIPEVKYWAEKIRAVPTLGD